MSIGFARSRCRAISAATLAFWLSPTGVASAGDSPTAANFVSTERLAAVERFVAKQRGRLGLPAVAVSIATPHEVVLAAAFGPEAESGAITARTPFFLGSVTKTLTASAALELWAEGRLDLDAPIESTLSDFSMRPPFEPRSITAHHLLQHRSGIRQWSGHDRRAQETGRADEIAPGGPPGAESEYSSLNYILLGRLVAAADGGGYADALRRHVLDPLGLADASVALAEPWPRNLAPGHQSLFGFQVRRREPPPPPALVPAGFVAASVTDLGRFGGALVGSGRFAGAQVLDPAAVAATLGPLDAKGAALGWGRSRRHGALVLEHAGSSRTSAARVRLVPSAGLAISVLTNTNSGPFFSATAELVDGIHAILAGVPAPVVWPRERLLEGALALGVLFALAQMGRRVRAWSRAGRPIRMKPSARALRPFAFELAASAVVLVGVPRYFGVPLRTLVEYFPDLGFALWISAVAGVVGGLFLTLARSQK